MIVAASLVAVIPVARGDLGSGPRETAPCVHHRHLPAFTAYSLGAEFAGLRRTRRIRECYSPPGFGRLVGPGPRSVAWTSYVEYGTCTPEGRESGCGPPLEIESWPECDLNFSPYSTKPNALRPSTSFDLSGSYKIPTALLQDRNPTQLGMYTGQTTIVIFATDPKLARQAAHSFARLIAPKLSSVSAASLRAHAVDTHGCRQA